MLLAERRPLALVLTQLDDAQRRLRAISPDHPRAKEILSYFLALAEEASEQDLFTFCRTLVLTQDDHDKASPFKPFPDEPYVKNLIEWITALLNKPNNRVGFIWKSRQMMVSWTAIATVLWVGMFEKGRTIGWQSKKAEDANWMLRRIFGVWERFPDEIKRRHPLEIREGELRFPDRNNVVMAVPEGPEKPRQFTWSLFISDEMAFQAQAKETYVAVQPAIRGGGCYIGISSAAPGFFQTMVEDEP